MTREDEALSLEGVIGIEIDHARGDSECASPSLEATIARLGRSYLPGDT
jgi:hypothetical protein